MSTPGPPGGRRIHVDPTRCVGYGVCAELFPERIARDDWGFAMVDPRPFDHTLLDHAERAVRACPAHALRIDG